MDEQLACYSPDVHTTHRPTPNQRKDARHMGTHRPPTLLSIDAIRDWYTSTHGPLPTLATPTHHSCEVSWLAAHERLDAVVRRARRHGDLPLIGTHDWCDLDDGDPRFVGTVFWAADMHALHLSARCHAMADASSEIAGAEPWSSRYLDEQRRQAWLRDNPWARREAIA